MFVEKWKVKYPSISKYFSPATIKYYFTYIEFDYSIRRYIYTTNGIENLNCQIRKATKHKISFENEDRLLDYVFVVIKDFERNNWLKYQVKSFKVWKEYEN